MIACSHACGALIVLVGAVPSSLHVPLLVPSLLHCAGQKPLWQSNAGAGAHLQLLLLGLPVPPDLDAAVPLASPCTGVSFIRFHLPPHQSLLRTMAMVGKCYKRTQPVE